MTTVALTVKFTLFIFIGYLAVKLKVVDDNFHKPLSSLMMNFAIPMLILRSFYNTDLAPDTFSQLGGILQVTAVTFSILAVLGVIANRMTKVRYQKKVAIYAMLTSNFTFFGMPFVESVFGTEGLLYYTLLTTFARIIYYGCPAYLLGDDEKGSFADFIKHMMSPSIICVFFGFVMYCFQIRPPEIIDGVVAGIATTCTPFGMMLCGMTLASAPLRESFSQPILVYMSIARLIICPAVVLLILSLTSYRILFVELAVTYCAMPFGALLPTFSTKYCSDERSVLYSSALVSLSTMLCIFTIPIWIFVFNYAF